MRVFFLKDDTCQNEVAYAADGGVSIKKSCTRLAACQADAALVNVAQCRRADGEASRCVYCCQGQTCNQELNTVNGKIYNKL